MIMTSSKSGSTLATKIFGLAVFLLCITITLVVFLVFEIDRTRRDMDIVAQHDVPLANTIFMLEESGLRQRLAFERLNGTLDSEKPNTAIIEEASVNHARFSASLRTHAVTARRQLSEHPARTIGQRRLAQAATMLDQIEKNHATITSQQQQVLELQKAGDHPKANALLNFLNDSQHALQEQRETLVKTLAAVSADSANAAAARQKTVLWLAASATLSAILLGLLVAAAITRRLVIPIRALVSAVADVEKGNLDVRIPVMSRDEVGQLAGSFNRFAVELRAKETLEQTFGKYLDPRVMEQVLASQGMMNGGPERRTMTVMFADLVGFTSLSEQLTASRMVELLNRHFTLQAAAIHENRGVVDKYIGDAVMAFWGPPFVASEKQATLACRAALAQVQALEKLRAELAEITGLRKNAPEVEMRIGICTGDVVVGNIGSDNTRSFTVMGDSVNLASRLEGANRFYGTTILMGEMTAQRIGDEFVALEIDAIEVKGKTETTRIFDLVGLRADLTEPVQQGCMQYTEALRDYRNHEWENAELGFRQCLELRPGYGPALRLLEHIAALRASPPDANWLGVHKFDQK